MSSVTIYLMTMTRRDIIYISIVIIGYTASMTFTAGREWSVYTVTRWLVVMVLSTTKSTTNAAYVTLSTSIKQCTIRVMKGIQFDNYDKYCLPVPGANNS